jgi:hypothetical protein
VRATAREWLLVSARLTAREWLLVSARATAREWLLVSARATAREWLLVSARATARRLPWFSDVFMSYSPVCRKSGEDDISSIYRLPVDDLDRNRVGTIRPLRERFDSANSCSPVRHAPRRPTGGSD